MCKYCRDIRRINWVPSDYKVLLKNIPT
jgi:hypothetical protein